MLKGIRKFFSSPLNAFILFSVLLLISVLYPVNSTLSRVFFLLFALAFIISLCFFAAKKKLLSLFLGIALVAIITALFSRKPVSHTGEIYLANLKSFEGTPYYWGGENFVGIDCSGLPRKSLINAYISTGQYSKAISNWWFDASARALGENYRNYTVKICSFDSLREVDYSQIKEGDPAITADGIHVIVYLGDKLWIQADPQQGEVVVENPKTTKSSWFNVKVNIVRWSTLNN